MKNTVKKTSTTKELKKAPKPGINRATHNIDATGKVFGRLATEIAILLRGKNKPAFQPYIDGGDIVVVSNAAKVKISGKKLEGKIYYRYSGYPGGITATKMGDLMDKNPSLLLKKSVYHMLPKNKLRDQMIKRLKITN